MKQQVSVDITVSFDDAVLQPDVDEAVVDAIANLRKLLMFLPTVKGKTSRGREVAFKIVDVNLPTKAR